jgi:hypothetical protein
MVYWTVCGDGGEYVLRIGPALRRTQDRFPRPLQVSLENTIAHEGKYVQ